MTRIEPKTLSEIEALMEERQKFEKWINSLGDRRSITPNHVYQRVLADYEDRMRVVSADLAGRSVEIEESMNFLRDKLATIQQEEETTADERAEAELRAAVGEYTSDKWEEIRREADENIARLSALRMELSGELNHLGTILSVAAPKTGQTPTPAPGSGDGRALRQPAAAPVETPPPSIPRPHSPVAVGAQRPAKEDTFDELAFLSSVVETEISQLAAHPVDLPRGRSETVVERSAPSVVERSAPAAPSSGSSKIVRSATPMISESINTASAAPADSDAGLRVEEPARAMFDKRLSGSVPAYLKDVPKEASKSLKCQECGTMNYPTEWYCERCGGELAAL